MQKDGKCDDGSTGEEDQVFCDLGTDCSDCGPWTFKVPTHHPNQTLPVKLLHSRQVSALCLPMTMLPKQQAGALYLPMQLPFGRQYINMLLLLKSNYNFIILLYWYSTFMIPTHERRCTMPVLVSTMMCLTCIKHSPCVMKVSTESQSASCECQVYIQDFQHAS